MSLRGAREKIALVCPLALIILAVTDLERAQRFYLHALQAPLVVDAPSYRELALPGGMRLGLYERSGFGRNTGQTPHPIPEGQLAPVELYFHPPDLPAAAARMSEAGARLLSPLALRPWGDEAVYFADPEGNVLVLARPGH